MSDKLRGNNAGWRGPWAAPLLKGDTFGDRNTERAETLPVTGTAPKEQNKTYPTNSRV